LPPANLALRRVLRGADLVIAAGGYPLAEGERAAGRTLPSVVVPPGVDTDRFVPLDADRRREVRRRHGLPEDGTVVLSVSRLVPRKGFDTLIDAIRRAGRDDVTLAVVGGGRDEARLRRMAGGAPVRFLGRVPDVDLPGLYGAADLFAMLCRDRWGGLEQEGFGIVFLEAAAAGVPSVAGRSGGSHEAVVDGSTGLVVDDPTDVAAVGRALGALIDDPDRRTAMGAAARRRAVAEFRYDDLARRLGDAIDRTIAPHVEASAS
jgi:phosphatidylinositol alpha-1,6-mannosyltransferase